jgi:hydroxyacylglutathione hydrolase
MTGAFAMHALEIHQFIAGHDNYCVLLHDPETGATASIDAPDGALIAGELAAKGWALTHILVTHHHGDHTVGILELKRATACKVIGPAAESHRIPGLDATVREGDTVPFAHHTFSVLETPGHTLGHIAYHEPEAHLAFVGDTLFTMGCGRVIEGDYPMMWDSLEKLSRLPEQTLLFCGHNYTAANARFALTIEPGNIELQQRARRANAGEAMVPSTIAEELATNPFLRAGNATSRQALGLPSEPAWKVFGEVRDRKNRA